MEATATKAIFQKYPAYKDSGVEWLGEIPEHWEVLRLASLGRFSASGIDKLIKKGESFVKIINYTDVYKNLKQTITKNFDLMVVTTPESNRINNLVKKGDLIFLPSSETFEDLGLSALVNEDLENTSFSYHVLRFSFTKELNHNFKKYFTNNSKVLIQFSKKGTGSIRKTLSRNDFRNTLVIIPPIIEQEKIAAFLDDKTAKIDRAIAQKEKMITLLKERKQIIIQNAVTKGLDPNAKMKDSGVEWIGEIPEHYSITKLGLCLKPISVKNMPDLPLLSITREKGVIVRDVEDQDTNHNFIPDDLSGYKVIRKGQFGMNKMKAWQGSYGVSKHDGIISPAYYVFDLISDINPDFFHIAVRSKIYVPFFAAASDGVRIGQWDLNKSRMKEIPIVVPPVQEQIKAIEHVKTQSKKIANAISQQQTQIEKLKEYKATLIDSAVTGKIKVS